MVGLLTPWEIVDSRVKRRSGSLIFVFRCPHVCVKVQRLPLLLQTNGDNQNFGSGPHGVPSLDSGKSIPVWEPPRNCSKRRDDPPHPPKKEKLWKSNQTFYVKKGFKKWRTSSFYSVDLIQSAVCLSVCLLCENNTGLWSVSEALTQYALTHPHTRDAAWSVWKRHIPTKSRESRFWNIKLKRGSSAANN